jgi:isopentenyl phosphate kinase
MNALTVLKIGGSIITDKSSPVPAALPDEITRIACEIAGNHTNLIIVHGAGSFGHPLAKHYRLQERFDIQGVMETHRSVKVLNSLVVDALASAGVPAVPVHPFSSFVLDNGRIIQMLTAPIRMMLEHTLVPVLHGDVAMDATKGAAIVSGDQIVTYIAQQFEADSIGIGSNTAGVLDDQGKVISTISPATFHEIRPYIRGSSHTDVTGGMLGKVQELVDIANTNGIKSRIFNAAAPGNIQKFLEGTAIGTLIQKDK